jgi:hypothetical protein
MIPFGALFATLIADDAAFHRDVTTLPARELFAVAVPAQDERKPQLECFHHPSARMHRGRQNVVN